ncbi:hypothetical protein CI102_10237 [Trichoderma harzianum]|nr:hypothetical protein CI102_10237 [Trichoderma harzianum]
MTFQNLTYCEILDESNAVRPAFCYHEVYLRHTGTPGRLGVSRILKPGPDHCPAARPGGEEFNFIALEVSSKVQIRFLQIKPLLYMFFNLVREKGTMLTRLPCVPCIIPSLVLSKYKPKCRTRHIAGDPFRQDELMRVVINTRSVFKCNAAHLTYAVPFLCRRQQLVICMADFSREHGQTGSQVSASHMPVKASQTLTSRYPSKYGSTHPEAGREFTRQWWIVETL